ncbi:MAG: hypothetical protein LBT36_03295, partial [Oscillospiraceae bacterium]|nr:hypothetical protein [Oscillospiraceae bacterium]
MDNNYISGAARYGAADGQSLSDEQFQLKVRAVVLAREQLRRDNARLLEEKTSLERQIQKITRADPQNGAPQNGGTVYLAGVPQEQLTAAQRVPVSGALWPRNGETDAERARRLESYLNASLALMATAFQNADATEIKAEARPHITPAPVAPAPIIVEAPAASAPPQPTPPPQESQPPQAGQPPQASQPLYATEPPQPTPPQNPIQPPQANEPPPQQPSQANQWPRPSKPTPQAEANIGRDIRESRDMSEQEKGPWNVLLNIGMVILGLVAVVLFAFLIFRMTHPQDETFFGYKPLLITTDSMEDTILTGALVIGRQVPFDSLAPQDIITFERSDGRLNTHRIVSFDGGAAITQGDNASQPDAGTVTAISYRYKVVLIMNWVAGLGSFWGVMGLLSKLALAALLITLAVRFLKKYKSRVKVSFGAKSEEFDWDRLEVLANERASAYQSQSAALDPYETAAAAQRLRTQNEYRQERQEQPMQPYQPTQPIQQAQPAPSIQAAPQPQVNRAPTQSHPQPQTQQVQTPSARPIQITPRVPYTPPAREPQPQSQPQYTARPAQPQYAPQPTIQQQPQQQPA